MKIIIFKVSVVGLMASFFVGCSALDTVKPWQKGTLAKTEMSFSPDPLERKLSDHTYFAKEATASSADVSGGGCGCN